MRSPSDKPVDPFDPLAYAPKILRERTTGEPTPEKSVSDYFLPTGKRRDGARAAEPPGEGARPWLGRSATPAGAAR